MHGGIRDPNSFKNPFAGDAAYGTPAPMSLSKTPIKLNKNFSSLILEQEPEEDVTRQYNSKPDSNPLLQAGSSPEDMFFPNLESNEKANDRLERNLLKKAARIDSLMQEIT